MIRSGGHCSDNPLGAEATKGPRDKPYGSFKVGGRSAVPRSVTVVSGKVIRWNSRSGLRRYPESTRTSLPAPEVGVSICEAALSRVQRARGILIDVRMAGAGFKPDHGGLPRSANLARGQSWPRRGKTPLSSYRCGLKASWPRWLHNCDTPGPRRRALHAARPTVGQCIPANPEVWLLLRSRCARYTPGRWRHPEEAGDLAE